MPGFDRFERRTIVPRADQLNVIHVTFLINTVTDRKSTARRIHVRVRVLKGQDCILVKQVKDVEVTAQSKPIVTAKLVGMGDAKVGLRECG